jgi:hypothetical protein
MSDRYAQYDINDRDGVHDRVGINVRCGMSDLRGVHDRCSVIVTFEEIDSAFYSRSIFMTVGTTF